MEHYSCKTLYFDYVPVVGRDGQLGTQLAHFTAPARELGVTTNDCSLPLEYDTWEAQDGGPGAKRRPGKGCGTG